MNTIYIVEDDSEIREMEAYALKSSGFDVNAFDCGKGCCTAIAAASTAICPVSR